jgi:hypothetical protein
MSAAPRKIALVLASALALAQMAHAAKSPDGRLRMLADAFVNTNEYAVRDGKIGSTGEDTPWQMRCR